MSGDKAMLHARWEAEDLIASRPSSVDADDPVLGNALIAVYEMGDLCKCALRARVSGIRGYRGESLLALGDTITQLRMLASRLGVQFWEALSIGEDRYMENMAAVRRREEGHDED